MRFVQATVPPDVGWRTQTMASLVLAAVVCQIGAQGLAGDVAWLQEVVQAPDVVPDADRGHFEPLLVNARGEPVRTLEQWRERRQEIRKAWLSFLGPMPDERRPVRLKVLHEDRDAGCIRQLVEYESEPGHAVQGYLLTPLEAQSKRLPALVALHQTSDTNIEEIAGIQGPERQHLAVKLARRGFVVFCPRNYLWQDVADYHAAVARFKARHPHTLGMHKMLYDAMRAIDVLESLPQVDSQRIGCVGHSLGGKEALYLAAFDERIRAAVASEPGMGFSFTNWDAPWYLGQGIQAEDFPLNHHQLVALIAPRPFLLLAGESGGRGVSDGDRSWPYLGAAHPICQLYGEPIRIGMDNHRQGHTVPDKSFALLAEWLETYLAE
ncbi:MAG: alpha/beta hydrolase family protein [Planctomycetaceae bacterium]